MKRISKVLCLIFAIGLLLCCAPAARAEIVVLDPEQSTTFSLEYEDVCAVEGQITFSNPAIISSIKYDVTNSNMEGLVENGTIFLYSDDPNGVSGRVDITVTLHSGAVKGASCNIIFQYATTAPGSTVPGQMQTVTNTVTVSTAGAEPTDPPATTDPPAGPTEPPAYADTSALREQISIAENLTYYDYTKETWSVVEAALENAINHLDNRSQAAVDQAAAQLKNALANLKSMDYSELIAAMEGAAEMAQHEDIAQAWNRFVAALENARIQRTSGDQEAVNAAATELNNSKRALIRALEEMGQILEVEVPVEVPTEPDYTYCNNVWHTIVLIIMIASLALNAVLTMVIVMYFVKKHKNKQDNTPLVEYDIDDDRIPE